MKIETPSPETPAALMKAIQAVNSKSLSGEKRRAQLNTIAITHREFLTYQAVSHLREEKPVRSASYILSVAQQITMLVVIFMMVTLIIGLPNLILPALTSIYTVYCIFLIVLRTWLLAESATSSGMDRNILVDEKAQDLPIITLLIPLYQEQESVPFIHKAIEQLSYPKHLLDIKLLLEESDSETISAVKSHGLAAHYQIIIIPDGLPRTKPKACNFGLWLARGELIVVYDAEDRPDTDQLMKAASFFAEAEADVACAQAKLNYYNPRRNILTRLFT
ncbi:MAG: glycosyltransferase, partial [Aquisalinus sp.]|nr:glycosyltransferase [Aquisalinus sp.]